MSFDPNNYVVTEEEVTTMKRLYNVTIGTPGPGNALSNHVTFPIELLQAMLSNFDNPEVTHLMVGFGVIPQETNGREENRLTVYFSPAKLNPDDPNQIVPLGGTANFNYFNRGNSCPPRYCGV
jgi:hypothetical protein